MKLIAAYALLARAHKEGGLKPQMQWDMALLEHGANANRELLPAIITLLQPEADAANAILHAIENADTASAATVRAMRTIRPDDSLKRGESRRFVAEI
jgi:hypothetical protein